MAGAAVIRTAAASAAAETFIRTSPSPVQSLTEPPKIGNGSARDFRLAAPAPRCGPRTGGRRLRRDEFHGRSGYQGCPDLAGKRISSAEPGGSSALDLHNGPRAADDDGACGRANGRRRGEGRGCGRPGEAAEGPGHL